jgi:hypothetical protein
MNDARKESFAQLGRRKSGSKFDPGREPKSQMPVLLEECCGGGGAASAASLAPMSRPAGPQLGRGQRKAPAASFEGIGFPSTRRRDVRGIDLDQVIGVHLTVTGAELSAPAGSGTVEA